MRKSNGTKHRLSESVSGGRMNAAFLGNCEDDDCVTWNPEKEADGSCEVFSVLERKYKWQLSLKEFQDVHSNLQELCKNVMSSVSRSNAWSSIMNIVEEQELPALISWDKNVGRSDPDESDEIPSQPHSPYIWCLPSHIGSVIDVRKPKPEMLCRLFAVLQKLAECLPNAACRYIHFLNLCRLPQMLQDQVVMIAFSLLPLSDASCVAPLSRLIFKNASFNSFFQIDDIEEWRTVLVAKFSNNLRVLCAIAEACFDTLAHNSFMLDLYLASLDVAETWSFADIHMLLLCLGHLEAFMFPFPTSRVRDVLCASVLRRAIVLDQLKVLLEHCCPYIIPLEDSDTPNVAYGSHALSLRAVFRLCDIFDDTMAAAAAAGTTNVGTSQAQMERTRLSLAKWSSTALFTLFSQKKRLRANIIDFALRKLIETNTHSVDSADSFLSCVMESRPELFNVHRKRIARWFFANASYCPLRAADVLSSVIASTATTKTFKTVSRLLFSPHLQCNQCAIVMACALLSQEPIPELQRHRISLLKKLLFVATHSPDILVSRESFHGISVLSDILPQNEYVMVQECLAQFTSSYVAPLSKSLPDSSKESSSSSGGTMIVAPENVVLSQLSAPTARAVEAGRSVALPPFLECLYRYQNPERQSSSLDTLSIERMIRTISHCDNSSGLPLVLGMQSITSVAISFASETAMTTVPGERGITKDQSMCQLALQCASLSRAVRLNLIQTGTSAMTEHEQRKFGAIAIEPMTAITCLPYLDACTGTSTGRQVSNKVLAERSVVLELLKNVESHAITLPKDGHALALAAGLPSLSAAFSGSPVISGILGSPQFLKWSISQTSVLAERVDAIRRSQTSTSIASPGLQLYQVELSILKHLYLLIRHALWFSSQTSDLSCHVLALMGFENSSQGVERLYEVLNKQFALIQERYLALCVVDILVIVSTRKDCSRRTCWEIAGVLKQYLCNIYSNTKEVLVLPSDVPRKKIIPLPLPKPPSFQGMWSYHYVIRAMFSLLGHYQSFTEMDSIFNALESFDPSTGFFEGKDGCVEHPTFLSLNWRTYCTFFVECIYALTILSVYDPEQGKSSVSLPVVIEVLKCFQRCLKMHRILVQGLGKPSALSYLLRSIVSVAIMLDNRLVRATEINVSELMRLSAEHDSLVCLVDRVVAYQIGQGVVDSKDMPCRARQAPLQIPHNLGNALARLSSRIDQLKDRCSSTPSVKEKGTNTVVLLLRSRPVRARDAQMSLIQCKSRAKKRMRTSTSSRKSTAFDGNGAFNGDGDDVDDDSDETDDSNYFNRPIEWRETPNEQEDFDDSDEAVRSEVGMLCSTQEEYEQTDRCFSSQFPSKYCNTDEVD